MAKAAILIDGGYYLKRLPAVRRDVDPTDPEAVGASVRQLIRSHLEHLNEVHRVPNFYGLLYRAFYYYEHIDGLRSGFPKPRRSAARPEDA